MLIRITAIFSISLLLMLQYGRITSFLYCEWEAKVIQQLPDCDCSLILTGVFDQDDDHSNTNISVSSVKFADYVPTVFQINFKSPHRTIQHFNLQPEVVTKDGFCSIIPRPPLA
ncbi:hypothetical protein [Pollutibacter soli]|uniref:hypothetical protein n=1 Tax=Pollutibacter soli TaxID=3034157 RepID=UPI00301374FA